MNFLLSRTIKTEEDLEMNGRLHKLPSTLFTDSLAQRVGLDDIHWLGLWSNGSRVTLTLIHLHQMLTTEVGMVDLTSRDQTSLRGGWRNLEPPPRLLRDSLETPSGPQLTNTPTVVKVSLEQGSLDWHAGQPVWDWTLSDTWVATHAHTTAPKMSTLPSCLVTSSSLFLLNSRKGLNERGRWTK